MLGCRVLNSTVDRFRKDEYVIVGCKRLLYVNPSPYSYSGSVIVYDSNDLKDVGFMQMQVLYRPHDNYRDIHYNFGKRDMKLLQGMLYNANLVYAVSKHLAHGLSNTDHHYFYFIIYFHQEECLGVSSFRICLTRTLESQCSKPSNG